MRFHAFLLVGVLTGGCSSGPMVRDSRGQSVPALETRDYDTDTNAHPYAYTAEHFVWHKPSPSRPANNFEFFYRRCERLGSPDRVTKADWTCTEAPLP